MDCSKVGNLIYTLRTEKGMTLPLPGLQLAGHFPYPACRYMP